MLLSLHIENIAVIRSVDIDFTDGFTVMTGETGAGKSILIDSMGLLLGAKAERELIRTGERCAMVSGLFASLTPSVLERLSAVGVEPDEEGNLLIQRTLTADGRSQVKINGRAVSLSVLREVTPKLMTIHGQNDTHSLTDPRVHLQLLDAYAGTEPLVAEYRALYFEYEKAEREIRKIAAQARDRERLAEMLLYQIRDIDAMKLREGEEEEWIDRKIKYKSSERIYKNAVFAYTALKGSEKGSVSTLLDRSISALSKLSDVLPECTEYAERLRDVLYQVNDVAEEAYAISEDASESASSDIDAIEERLDKISKMKRKYGATVAEVLAFRDRAKAEYDTIVNAEDAVASLERQRDRAYEAAVAKAEVLHARRLAAVKSLENGVKATLEFLDMPRIVFFGSIKESFADGKKVLYEDGTDKVEFFISPNRGADPQPLGRIASGGELARIMLALKCELSEKDGQSTLIFDEIDAGVSGKTARKIGIKMSALAGGAQVFCVTHSAQISSLGDCHYLIRKSEQNGATETEVLRLNEEQRIAEVSRILGGLRVTDAQRSAAIDMLKERENYRAEDVKTET